MQPSLLRALSQTVRLRLHLAVEDDGIGLPTSGPVSDGVGLRTTRARLAQLYGGDARFAIGPAAGGGTLCAIEMPCSGRARSAEHGRGE